MISWPSLDFYLSQYNLVKNTSFTHSFMMPPSSQLKFPDLVRSCSEFCIPFHGLSFPSFLQFQMVFPTEGLCFQVRQGSFICPPPPVAFLFHYFSQLFILASFFIQINFITVNLSHLVPPSETYMVFLFGLQ